MKYLLNKLRNFLLPFGFMFSIHKGDIGEHIQTKTIGNYCLLLLKSVCKVIM